MADIEKVVVAEEKENVDMHKIDGEKEAVAAEEKENVVMSEEKKVEEKESAKITQKSALRMNVTGGSMRQNSVSFNDEDDL